MSKQASQGGTGNKVALNPQPLPPRWLPSWLGQLVVRLGLVRR